MCDRRRELVVAQRHVEADPDDDARAGRPLRRGCLPACRATGEHVVGPLQSRVDAGRRPLPRRRWPHRPPAAAIPMLSAGHVCRVDADRHRDLRARDVRPAAALPPRPAVWCSAINTAPRCPRRRPPARSGRRWWNRFRRRPPDGARMIPARDAMIPQPTEPEACPRCMNRSLLLVARDSCHLAAAGSVSIAWLCSRPPSVAPTCCPATR